MILLVNDLLQINLPSVHCIVGFIHLLEYNYYCLCGKSFQGSPGMAVPGGNSRKEFFSWNIVLMNVVYLSIIIINVKI